MKLDSELGEDIKSLHIFLLTEESETINGSSKQKTAPQASSSVKQLL